MPLLINDVNPQLAYTATAGQTIFPYPFVILDDSDIVVEKNGTVLALTTHYTVSGVGIGGGGNVTLVSGASALDAVVVYRDMPLERQTDYSPSGDFPADTLDTELIRLVLMIQQLNRDIDRSVQVPLGETAIDLPVAATRAGKALVFDASGDTTVATISGTSDPSLRADIAASSGSTLVGFLQAGTGATARTLQGRLRDTVNVKDFGAVGGGVTDDTAAIVAALAALPANGGDLLYDGVFLIASTITVNKRVRLVGAGGMAITGAPSSYFKKKATMTSEALLITATDVVMEGGGVLNTAGATGGGIVVNANNFTGKRVTCSGVGGASAGVGIRVGKDSGINCNSWKLDSCVSYGWSSHGFYFHDNTGAAPDCNAGTAIGCIGIGNGGDGFRVGNATLNTFVGCLGEGNTGYGFKFDGGSANWILGGDYEGNTAGQVIFTANSNQNGIQTNALSVTVTDQGFFTKRLDRYTSKFFDYTPALIGASGTVQTITAEAVSGTTITMTSAAHGYSNGDMVYIESGPNGVENGAFVISGVTANTFDITYRTDVIFATPTSQSGLSVPVQKCGVYGTAKGRYRIVDGKVEFQATIVTSAITNITGTVQLIMPTQAADNVGGGTNYGGLVVNFYGGITHTGRLQGLITQGGTRIATLYENIGSTLTPGQLQDTGLAAATSLIVEGHYFV